MSAEVFRTSDFTQPLTHHAHVGFDNWGDFMKDYKVQTKDPDDTNFNWFYWCGIQGRGFEPEASKQDQQIKQMAAEFNSIVDDIPTEFINFGDGVAERTIDGLVTQGTLTEIEGACLKETIKNLYTDVTQHSGQVTPGTLKDMWKVLFVIYVQEAKKGRWYVRGEINLLLKIKKSITDSLFEGAQELLLLYSIYLSCVIKTPMKDMVFPSKILEQGHLFSADRVTPQEFLSWLIFVIIVKKHEFIPFDGPLAQFNTNEVDDFFSHVIDKAPSWINGPEGAPLLQCTNADFKKIFGDLLVGKDITQWVAYVASFWCNDTLKPKKIKPSAEPSFDFLNRPFPPYYQHTLAESWGNDFNRANIYENDLDTDSYKRIYKYFGVLEKQGIVKRATAKQRTKFEGLVLSCTKKYKKGVKTESQTIKKIKKLAPDMKGVERITANQSNLFIFPTKLDLLGDIWNGVKKSSVGASTKDDA